MGNKKNYLSFEPFDNIRMIHPDGHLMCYISKRKARWYTKNKLAENIDNTEIRLLFVPNGIGEHADVLKHRNQTCVVSNSSEHLTKHHVIPTQFRVYFPMQYKSKNSSDIVIMNRAIHDEYEKHANLLKMRLYAEFITDEISNIKKEYFEVFKYFKTLKNYKYDVPPSTQIFFEMKISSFLKRYDLPEDYDFFNSKVVDFIDENKLIVEAIGVERMILLWKYHFLKYAKPIYLGDWWKPNMVKIIKDRVCELKYIDIDDNFKKILIKYDVWQ